MPLKDYPHLQFRRCWTLTPETLLSLGHCVAVIDCLGAVPIAPELQHRLRNVAFQRGAQATTAIEGNTLSDDELQQLLAGQELPKSRTYQAQEVQNALAAMNSVWERVVQRGATDPVTPQLLCEFNRMIGRDLGPLYDGVPGRIRRDRRHVGKYLAPPPEAVKSLLEEFCGWLKSEFGFHTGRQPLHESIVQAVVAHVFYEWIHPFADGNGRTGRLLEFYILLRAGLPDIAAHVLANHYNTTRTEYASHFDRARRDRDLSAFLAYAVQGLQDGLTLTLNDALADTIRIVWRSHVYDVFADYSTRKKSIVKRRRELALSLPPGEFTPEQLLQRSEALLKQYFTKDRRALLADLQELCTLGLVEQTESGYRTATSRLQGHFAPRAARAPQGPSAR